VAAEAARYDWIMQQAATSGSDLPTLVTEAMTAIEAEFKPLDGVLPKDYGIFEPKVLEDLMRLFNSAQIKQPPVLSSAASTNTSLPSFPSRRRTITVSSSRPLHWSRPSSTLSSPIMALSSTPLAARVACSCNPAISSSTRAAIRPGEEPRYHPHRQDEPRCPRAGKIAEAITYYQDEHTLVSKCDFVMANPPFNVDLVDAKSIKSDPRLPFGLPGVNKANKVSNGNYLWISYFWSYLNEKGRAGFVMSSQASSAGHSEKEVRKKIVETGDVDVIISIRSNFFYTRTVPCELWFFDRAKPAERKDKVLMLDARQVYRKVTRTIYDFSPEQMQNLSAIVWLYRGQQHRFLALVRDYLGAVCTESTAIPAKLAAFEKTHADLRSRFAGLIKSVDQDSILGVDQKKALKEAAAELADAETPYETDLYSAARGS
jgi:type I restriction enzyme M protein